MKKVTLILTLILGVLLFNSSKKHTNDDKPQKTRQDSLMNKKWIDKRNLTTSMVFNQDAIVIKGIGRRSKFTLYNPYYLTDDISKMELINGKIINFDWV